MSDEPEHEAEDPPDKGWWTGHLNKYHRDNLLWLFAAIGTVESEHGRVEPFHLALTGDWAGEVPFAVLGAPENGRMDLAGTEPNVDLAGLQGAVDQWMEGKLLEARDAVALRADRLDGSVWEAKKALWKLLDYTKKLRARVNAQNPEPDAEWDEVLQATDQTLQKL